MESNEQYSLATLVGQLVESWQHKTMTDGCKYERCFDLGLVTSIEHYEQLMALFAHIKAEEAKK
jgi:hypothetical protein